MNLRRRIEYTVGLVLVVAVLVVIAWAAFTVGTAGAVVELSTTPERASAFVDGHFIGTTPVPEQPLLPGKHVLRVAKFGYVPLLREIDVHTGRNVLSFELAECPGGTLEITSTPPDAEVFVDGESSGRTPRTLRKLSTGGHRVRITLVNYLDWTSTVDIEENRTVKLDVKLNTRTEAVYLEAIRTDPNNVVLQVDLAHYYITRSEWQKAEDAFAKALVLTATVGQSAHYSGQLQQELEKVFKSMFKYEDVARGREVVVNALVRAVREAPKYLTNYSYAVHYSIQANRLDKAQEILETGILTFPYDQNWPLTALRNEFQRQGDGDKLLRTLDQRIKKNPDDFVSRFQRMTLQRQKGGTDEVIDEHDHLVRLANSSAVKSKLLVELGRLWERKREYVKAADAYRKALETETTEKEAAPIQYNLVRALAHLDDHDRTLTAWKEAVRLQENVEVACRWRLEWAQLAVKAEKKDQARSVLDDVLRLSQDPKTRTEAERLRKTLEDK